MEPFLLYRDSSSDGKKSYAFPRDIIKDLNLDIIFKTMARTDDLILEKVRRVMLIPLMTPEEIIYRQEVLRDLRHEDMFLEDLYECAKRQNKALKDYKEAVKNNRAKSTRKTGELFETLNYLLQGQADLIRIREILIQKQEEWQSEGIKALLKLALLTSGVLVACILLFGNTLIDMVLYCQRDLRRLEARMEKEKVIEFEVARKEAA